MGGLLLCCAIGYLMSRQASADASLRPPPPHFEGFLKLIDLVVSHHHIEDTFGMLLQRTQLHRDETRWHNSLSVDKEGDDETWGSGACYFDSTVDLLARWFA